ncbi:Eaa protein [Salmonella enterica subsp. salamae]|nr:Eaa protein [Salmonella enterica subsp. salamae]SQH38981.1 Eaa protein [Salmonella enterica]
MELIKRVQFTKEQLIEAAQEDIAAISDALQCYMPCAASKSLQKSLVLKEIALASLNAKPIGAFHILDQQVGATTDYIKDGEWPISNGVIEVYAAPPAPVAPKTLPCSVELKPGLIIGKGCKTETLLTALRRRAEYYAKLEAMTPEERAKHGASIEAFKTMLPQPAPVDKEFIPKNLDKALGVVGVALPESKEEFNFQIERWIQRLIDRVIRYADEFKEQPVPVVPPEKWVNPDINYAEENGFAEGWNACRAAMLKGGAK